MEKLTRMLGRVRGEWEVMVEGWGLLFVAEFAG